MDEKDMKSEKFWQSMVKGNVEMGDIEEIFFNKSENITREEVKKVFNYIMWSIEEMGKEMVDVDLRVGDVECELINNK